MQFQSECEMGHLEKSWMLNFSPNYSLHQVFSEAEIYSKSICVLFKQQFVSSLPCLILYSLFSFKFPKGIIININWSLSKRRYTQSAICIVLYKWEHWCSWNEDVEGLVRGKESGGMLCTKINFFSPWWFHSQPFFHPHRSSNAALGVKLSTEHKKPSVPSI